VLLAVAALLSSGAGLVPAADVAPATLDTVTVSVVAAPSSRADDPLPPEPSEAASARTTGWRPPAVDPTAVPATPSAAPGRIAMSDAPSGGAPGSAPSGAPAAGVAPASSGQPSAVAPDVVPAAPDVAAATVSETAPAPAPAAASAPAATAAGATAGPSAESAAAQRTELAAAVRRVPYAALGALQGESLLAQLTVQPRSDLARYFTAHPGAVDAILAAPPAATTVEAWWAEMSPPARHTLAAAAPALVGNLDGLPYSARDEANRLFLASSIERISEEMAVGVGRARLDVMTQQLDTLEQVRAALDAAPPGERRYLVVLGSTDAPTAAIAVGDPDTADHVAVLVPGMFFGVDAQIGSWTDVASGLQREATTWLDRTDGRGTVAAVAWIGYQTPTLVNIASLDLAREGSAALDELIRGIEAARGDDRASVTVIAHSYGSTAALMALTGTGTRVDALALLGSPGSGAADVDDLGVDGGVYVGEAAWDPIPNCACFGSDPGDAAYGSVLMGVDGGADPVTGDALTRSVGHNDYFSEGSESLRNLALVVIGRGDLVTTAR
jgi:hypothetical protein